MAIYRFDEIHSLESCKDIRKRYTNAWMSFDKLQVNRIEKLKT